MLSPFLCIQNLSISLIRKSLLLALFFISFNTSTGCCYCWLLFFVFCYSYLHTTSEQGFCRVSTKKSIKSSLKFCLSSCSGTQLAGEGGGLPCPFLKIEKIDLILYKRTLIVFIFALNPPFKM